jgi:O-antigen/teichoic acid export membrane protein
LPLLAYLLIYALGKVSFLNILLAYGEHIILILFGQDFQQAIPAFHWLLLGTIAWSTIYVTWNHVSAGGRPELGLPIFAGAALIDAVLNVILLPKMGVVGAGIAATVSYFFAAAIFLMIFLKSEKCTVLDALLIRSDDLRSIFKFI